MKLYVHIPFCKSKCLYCDFRSFPCSENKCISDYLNGLNREIALAGADYNDRKITSVYIGGGTPSLLSVEQFRSVFDTLKSSFNIPESAEFTVECNPESITREKLEFLRCAGANRISLGVQSLLDKNLKAIGRIHTSATALEKIKLVKEYFDNLSVDFIVGLPYDTFDVVKEEIESVSPMVDHVSVYMLQVEEGTPLKKMIDYGKMSVPDEDTQVDLFEHACRVLSEQGFERYEVSNFSKNGRQSNHNVGYWTREEYLGLGLNASGLIFDTKTGVQKRIKNTENLEKYLLDARNCATYLDFDREESLLSNDEIFEEKIMLGLRLNTGVDKSLLGQNRLNILLSKFGKYVASKGDKVALTGEGMDIMNRILVEILD